MADVLAKNRVFVGGISWKADEASLANFFSTYGPVTECKIIMDRATGKSKGYGFVTFQDAEAAERVKLTANFFFLGKNMNVGDAMRKSEGGDNSGNGSDSSGGGSTANGGRDRRNQHGYSYQYYNNNNSNNNYYSRQQDEYQQYYGQYPNPHNTPFYPPQQSFAYSAYSQPGYMQSVQYQQYGAPTMQPMGYTGQPYGNQHYQDNQQPQSIQETQSQQEQQQQQQPPQQHSPQQPQVEENS